MIGRKATGAGRLELRRAEACEWAEELAVSRDEAFRLIGLGKDVPGLSPQLVEEGTRLARQSGVEMGGPADMDLLHRAILAIGARRVIETGVAYGWSSLAVLAALRETDGYLVSVDMPYPKANNEPFVGIVVPQTLRGRWTLIRRPDRNGLKQAIARFGGQIDLCHYDSDKSYPGRRFAYPLLWSALRPGGLLISDDISDNFAFRDFFDRLGQPYVVIRGDGKHVGIARKPGPDG